MRILPTRILLATLALLIAAAPAGAISRYNAWKMSCEEARGTILAEGAVILNFRSTFNPSIPRYGRFVADQQFCSSSELAEITYIPTADTRSCPVWECHLHDFDDDFPWRRR
jgi:hypothetical protein